ncbi:unnamed protein product [Coffea canephora]|uniref:Uncharacterized protein n=1 Tax=Coffea canephora TaxID=49390 RepID=A0A068UG12_COFCA|nr:unnamed protein product [Coffea canephora]
MTRSSRMINICRSTLLHSPSSVVGRAIFPHQLVCTCSEYTEQRTARALYTGSLGPTLGAQTMTVSSTDHMRQSSTLST